MLTILVDLHIYVCGRLAVVQEWNATLDGIEHPMCWMATLYFDPSFVDGRLVPSMMRWRCGQYTSFAGLDLVEVTQRHDTYGYLERYIYEIILEDDATESWSMQLDATES